MQSYTDNQHQLIDEIDRAVSALGQIEPLSDRDYARCLDVFEAASDQRLSLIDWIGAKAVPQLPQDQSSVLSIGCGAGLFDEKILQSAKAQSDAVHYLGIDPNEHAAAAFQTRLSALTSTDDRIDVLAEPFGVRPLDRHFDLILMIQSLYYFDDRPGAIAAAIDRLQPGGQLVIAIAPDEALNVIANLIWQNQMERTSWFSHNVREHFKKEDLAVDVTRLSSRLILPRGLDRCDDVTRDILDFTIQTQIGSLPPPLAKSIDAFLQSFVETHEQHTWLPHPVDIFRYVKPTE